MDLSSFISMLALLVVVLCISLYAVKLFIWKTTPAVGIGGISPPGKTGWPIIGEGLEFLRASRNGAPEKFYYDRIQRYSSKIFTTSLFGVPITVMSGASGNKFLFTNEYRFVNTWWPASLQKILPFAVQATTEEETKKLRKLYPQFLHPEALQRYISIMDSMTRRHFETCWDNKNELNVFPLVKTHTFSLACRLFLSIDDQTRVLELLEPLKIVANGLIRMPINIPGTPFNRAIKATKVILKEIASIIKERKTLLSSTDIEKTKALANQDMLSNIILFGGDNGQVIDEMDIAQVIMGLLIGGHDTITSSITVVMKYLAELPHVYNELLKEQTEIAMSKATGESLNWADIQKMKYSWNVVCEALRLAPANQGGFKVATTDFTYEGYFIPKGQKLHWSAISTHKNPEYFTNPEDFDPSRFEGDGPAPYTFIPFGGGPRICPGKEYARTKILVFMHHLVRRYKWELLNPDDDKIIFNPLPLPAKGLSIVLQPQI